jgi:hypothetical protein
VVDPVGGMDKYLVITPQWRPVVVVWT